MRFVESAEAASSFLSYKIHAEWSQVGPHLPNGKAGANPIGKQRSLRQVAKYRGGAKRIEGSRGSRKPIC